MAAADRSSRPTPEDESNEMEIEKSPSKSDVIKETDSTSSCIVSTTNQETISKNKHRFKHSILMDKTTSFSQDTGLWWLVYIEQEGMYCLLCKKHNNLNPNNKDIFCKKPGLRYRKEAIQDHSKSKVHKAAELEENIQSISIPERGKNMHQKYFLLHLLRCIGWLKKRRQTTNLMH